LPDYPGHCRENRLLKGILSKLGYEKKPDPVTAIEAPDVHEESEKGAFHTAFNGSFGSSPFAQGVFGGETISGGIRNKVDYNHLGSIDYYSLRALSRKLFVENKYAGMALGRLATNVLNEGLKPESIPPTSITGFDDEATVNWTEKLETLFKLYAEDEMVDWERVHNFSALQKVVYMESLVEGDVLIQLKVNEETGLPSIKVVSGRHVATGINSDKLKAKGNTVEFGVELDKKRRHIAYHVLERNKLGFVGTEAVRILAKGRNTGRPNTFLVYESPPPAGKVRGFPILTRILQATDQIETYAIYEMEASKLNASLAMWVEKTKERAGSNPLAGVGKRNAEDAFDGIPKTSVEAGMLVKEVAYGEKLNSFKTDRPNVNFKAFKDTVLEDIAAALEIPPEILQLKFGNNFSASRQAEIEFKTYVRKARKYFSDQFNKKFYNQWLTGMVFRGLIQANGYIEAVNSGNLFTRNGWQLSKWIGFVKQNVDIFKEAKAYELYIEMGIMTREQAAGELTEADYRSAVKRLLVENEMLALAKEPLPGDINTSKSIVADNQQQEEEDEEENNNNNNKGSN